METQPSNPSAQPGVRVLPAGILRAEALHFGYEPGRLVLRDFSAAVEAGQVCALIGPNAVGKTTLLKLLMGQLTPAHGHGSGRVWLHDQPVERLSPTARAAWLSYVPQRAGASFAFTVRQVVEMGRYALSRDETAVDAALAACDLSDLRERVYATLSMGQQQRVLLARALAQAGGPQASLSGKVMLLDEPGSAMDLWHTHQTMLLLRTLAARGLAVLVVLHDLNLAARYADLVWLMHEGRLAARGTWREVLQPAVLEPVYRVRLRALATGDEERPIFAVAAAVTG